MFFSSSIWTYRHSFSAALQVSTVRFAIESETGTVIQEQALHFSVGGPFVLSFSSSDSRSRHALWICEARNYCSSCVIIADVSGQIQTPGTEAGEAWYRIHFRCRRIWNANLRLPFQTFWNLISHSSIVIMSSLQPHMQLSRAFEW